MISCFFVAFSALFLVNVEMVCESWNCGMLVTSSSIKEAIVRFFFSSRSEKGMMASLMTD